MWGMANKSYVTEWWNTVDQYSSNSFLSASSLTMNRWYAAGVATLPCIVSGKPDIIFFRLSVIFIPTSPSTEKSRFIMSKSCFFTRDSFMWLHYITFIHSITVVTSFASTCGIFKLSTCNDMVVYFPFTIIFAMNGLYGLMMNPLDFRSDTSFLWNISALLRHL